MEKQKQNLHARNNAASTTEPYSVWIEKAVTTTHVADCKNLEHATQVLKETPMPKSEFPVKIRIYDNFTGTFLMGNRTNLPEFESSQA